MLGKPLPPGDQRTRFTQITYLQGALAAVAVVVALVTEMLAVGADARDHMK
ncbi:hypothetical protein GCM10009610_69580 [Pseudonocardia xinjiangensis]